MPVSARYRASPRITSLGGELYDEVSPARFPRHVLRFRNQRAAETVGLGELDSAEWEAHFARFEPLPGNLAAPLALRYHGHQFDVYNPYLGDGRGFLFAQLEDDTGRLLDLGTKGSGRTPWSRSGDGRLTLKGGVREVLATEMLEALSVSTSRSFSLFETGESLMRGDEPSPTRSSVLVRLSHSHVRFGTFQRLAHLRDLPALERLLSYSIANYYPDVVEGPDRAARFLASVTRATASLCASFMVAGFVHGVLNSDNMCITGEAFDFGPYRFLPTYDEDFVAAYFDASGLYSFGNQPRAFLRNLTRLADALRLVAPGVPLGAPLAEFAPRLEQEVASRVVVRLGLAANADLDGALVAAAFAFLKDSQVGYDRFFFDLHGGLRSEARMLAGDSATHYRGARWVELRELLALYRPANDVRQPYFERARPCSLLIDEVEHIWSAIDERDDWAPFEAKVAEIRAIPGAFRVAVGTPEP
jgi:uncharacterized protein YdiU (UPF0061 family)